MAKKKKEPTLLDLLVEVVRTHPYDTITVAEIMKEVPKGTNKHSVQNYVAKILRRDGMLRPIGNTLPKVYKILKRGAVEAPWTAKAKSKVDAKEPEIETGPEISDADLGRMVYAAHEDLKNKFMELTNDYSDMQVKLKEQKESYEGTLKKLNNRVRELNSLISALRNRISEKEGRKFRLDELVTIKGR